MARKTIFEECDILLLVEEWQVLAQSVRHWGRDLKIVCVEKQI